MDLLLHERARARASVIPIASDGTGIASFQPEESPFTTLFVDLTHRCNMACHNCYIPNREIPDMSADWLYSILARLPRRTRIRLVGAEPTLRKDLPEIIKRVRELRHLPVLLTNGLRLRSAGYVRRLKDAGLRTVHLSMNGGLDDQLYFEIDAMRCARAKLAALENLCAQHAYVTVGMILVRGVNAGHVRDFWRFLERLPAVREVHFRSIGAMGRYLPCDAFKLDEMVQIVLDAMGVERPAVSADVTDANNFDFRLSGRKIAITQWPDVGSRWRGRLTPQGTLEPFFEHLLANAAQGGY